MIIALFFFFFSSWSVIDSGALLLVSTSSCHTWNVIFFISLQVIQETKDKTLLPGLFLKAFLS